VLARAEGDVHVFTGDTPAGSPDGTFTNYLPGFIDYPNEETFHLDSADLTGDGNVDFVIGSAEIGGNVRVMIGSGSGTFAPSSQSPIATGGSPVHVAIGFVDGDNILDIVSCNLSDARIDIFLGDDAGTGRNTNGTFTQFPSSITVPLISPGQPALADFNMDNNLDIVVPHFDPAAAYLTIWLGDGVGNFTESPARPAVGFLSEYCAAGNLDADAFPDIAASNTAGELHVLYGDGTGQFTPSGGSPYTLMSGGRVVLIDDFTNDGKPDIAVAGESPSILSIFVSR
ncbi:MAG: VCBS repeat-containing protein, partial [Planctomycetota bacterium]|nr:VCBS repeat-containing protein [Planctomycetota bacterium]